jgi:hypothetical protein
MVGCDCPYDGTWSLIKFVHREMCVTVGDVGGFSLSDPCLLLFFYRPDVMGSWVCQFAFPGSRGALR